MAPSTLTFLAALTLLVAIATALGPAAPTDTSTTVRSGKNLLPLCAPCRYDAQCTSCKCMHHRCVPEHNPSFVCNKPECASCSLSAECRRKSCVRGKCTASTSTFFNCPATRVFCQTCHISRTCKTGNCVIDRCARNRRDYYTNCPYTRPACTACNRPHQCRRGLTCYRNKCVKDNKAYFNCPGTRGRCQKCQGKSFLCATGRKCIGGVCAKNFNEYNECTKCCYFDRCQKRRLCVKKGGILYNSCKNIVYSYSASTCSKNIYKCCFNDACSGKRKCIKPSGFFYDSCGAKYQVRHDCKLIQKKREELCCYSDKCFVSGLNVRKKCVKKGGILTDTCGGSYDVANDCSLKRKVCCYKVPCAHKTYCNKVGATIHVKCGRSFKVLANCRVSALHRQIVLDLFNKQSTNALSHSQHDAASDVPQLIPIEDRVELS